MAYLRDNPAFVHAILLERDDALWLVPDDRGHWTLPGFVSDEQHTAEVELVVRRMRALYGVRVSILGTVATDFDEATNCMRKTYLAEALTDMSGAGRWWPRTALAAGAATPSAEARAPITGWVTRSLDAGDTAWSRSGWLAQAMAWVSAHAGPVADVEQVRMSEFSTVIRIVAGGCTRYFKAVAPTAAREPSVTAVVARHTEHVPRVVAVDGGFLLMDAFAGQPLASKDIAVWAAVARALVDLQQDCIDAVAELRTRGCEVITASTLVEPLATLLVDADALLVGEPAGLTADEVGVLRALAPGLGAAARALDAGPLPLTVDHGDLWPSNVLVGPGGCAFVDWEDTRLTHPFVGLFQLLAGAHLEGRFADEAAAHAAIRDAYLSGWTRWAPMPLLRATFDVAHDVAAVAVAASYRRYAPAVVAAHPWMREMPPFCLRRILTRRGLAQ